MNEMHLAPQAMDVEERVGEPMPEDIMRRREASIVPADSIAGRALVSVIAIMSFLAALTLGAVIMVRDAAVGWQSAVAREVTIQVRPVDGKNIDAEVARAVEIATAFPGVVHVRPYSKEESTRLLEPWLGSGLALADLPVPRIIGLRLSPETVPDYTALRRALADKVAAASLDDHRGWVERMRAMTTTAVMIGLGLLVLVMAATMLSVAFATRGAMSTNRPVVEVLHFIGAKDGFIAGQFQRHFLLLGLKGGVIGGGAAIAMFLIARGLGHMFTGTAGEEQVTALFGNLALGPQGYGAMVGLIILIAAVTAGTSRLTVRRTLRSME